MQEADKELLIRYFYGTCSTGEKRRAQELLQTPEAEEFFRRLSLKEWDEPVQKNDSASDTYARWKEKVHARIHAMEKATPKKNGPILWLQHRLRYAAVWLGILLLSALAVWQWKAGSQTPEVALIERSNQQGIPVRYLLPDSSEIYLAAGSTISYAANFTGKTREISLRGEAFFQVTPNPDKPFIIHTDDIRTKVLGTSFKITALEGRPIAVAVATGKVGVSRQEQALATLTPGYSVTWYPKAKKAITAEVSIDGLEHWKNGDLVFDRLDMEYIAEELQRRYGVTLVFKDATVKANRVSGTFAASKTVDQVMKTLSMAGKFSYESKDKTFVIYKAN